MDANDFTGNSLLGSDGVYAEFYKGDKKGHVFRGNQHSPGGIGHFDPYKATFTTICASGHQNTVQVPPQWIERDAQGRFTGQFASGANNQTCTTCQRPLANRWRLVDGQKFMPKPAPPRTYDQWFYGLPSQKYVD